MAALSIVALLAGVAGAVVRPGRLPAWAVALVGSVVVVLAGALTWSGVRHALDPLGDPLAFLLAAVPLVVLLDGVGFFAALTGRLTLGTSTTGRLWILAALVTTVLNLDASVVLLTPLYVGVARRQGQDPLLLAAQPVLLACLASSALPVSNLTNLIATAHSGVGTGDFLSHLGLPSLVATIVGYAGYRRLRPVSGNVTASPMPPTAEEADRRALLVGGLVVGGVTIGFTCGRLVGVAPWEVALAAVVVLLGVELGSGRLRVRALPWRSIPVGTALVAATLAVLAAAAARHLPVHHLVGGTSVADQARTMASAALGANLVNNLPALLVGLSATGHGSTPALWAVLVGVNMGPVILATGSLASLLWLASLGRLGVEATARDFTRIGLRAGLPGALAGAGTALIIGAVHL